MLKPGSTFPIRLAEEQSLDRRRLLRLAGAAAVAACAGEWMARPPSRAEPSAAPPLRVPDLADLGPGAARAIAIGEREVLVARLGDGDIVAFDRRCPHLGCPVVFAAVRERFECPCHQAAFDARTGRVLFGPPRSGLTPVEVLA